MNDIVIKNKKLWIKIGDWNMPADQWEYLAHEPQHQ